MDKEFEVSLSNGYVIQIFKHKDRTVVALLDSNGNFVSETVLSEEQKKSLKEIVTLIA